MKTDKKKVLFSITQCKCGEMLNIIKNTKQI